MPLIEYPDVKQVVICGDIHGAFETLVYKACILYGIREALIIVAGDCGFGFEKERRYTEVYNHVAGRLRKADNYVAFVRGNHDDPSYFSQQKIPFKRWRTVPDYTVIRAAGHDILCVGGAISVDRMERIEENARRAGREVLVYWPDEGPTFPRDLEGTLPAGVRIDTVVTHSAPSFCELRSKAGLSGWAAEDPALVGDIERERQTLDALHGALLAEGHPVSRWYYGHFHQTRQETIDGIRFRMLDIEELISVK